MSLNLNYNRKGKVTSTFFRSWLGREKKIYLQDDLYRRLRDDPQGADLKEKIELLWREFESFAPKPFLRNAQIDFHQRWREMYLTVGLHHLSNSSGFKVETSKHDEGPDVKIAFADRNSIWVEAVAPDPGNGTDCVPEHPEDCVFDVPHDECMLRLAQALIMKREKFEEYQSKNSVSHGDHCIIALSSCALNQFGHLLDFPCPAPLKLLSGADKLVLRKNGPSYVSKRRMIKKISGCSVPACLVEDHLFDIISAIIYSSEDPLNAPSDPESTFQLFLNPRAKAPLPKFLFNNIETWYCEKNKNGEEWKKISCNDNDTLHES
jgi:hypothetical protein